MLKNKCYNETMASIIKVIFTNEEDICMKKIRKQAQSLIEYGLILALVAIVALTVMSKLGTSVNAAGDNASNSVNETSSGAMNTYCNSLGGQTYNATTGRCN